MLSPLELGGGARRQVVGVDAAAQRIAGAARDEACGEQHAIRLLIVGHDRVVIGVQIADNVHPVANPAVDRQGNVYTTFSGARGQKTPVAVYKIDLNYTPNASVERQVTANDPEQARSQRWAAFKQLLSSPRLASGLR